MSEICFLVGSVGISGGTYVIFQHAHYLQTKGFKVTLAVQEPFGPATYAWHPYASNLTLINFEEAKQRVFDLVIATWWKTALELAQFHAERYAYFVQSIESRFYPEYEQPLRRLVDATYQFGVAYVTEVDWIRQHLLDHHGQQAAVVRNGIRKDLYHADMARSDTQQELRVVVEGPFRVKFKNVGRTIQLVKKAGVTDITLLTSSPVSWIPGVNRLYSRVPITSVPGIYQSCDVLVKLSSVEGMFGPPLEMFHCGGTAVVYDVSGYDEYICHEGNALVAAMGDEDAVVAHIRRLMRDRDLLRELRVNAALTAQGWPSWEQSSEQFHEWTVAMLNQAGHDRAAIEALTAAAWRDYVRDEAIRLQGTPKPLMRHRMAALARRLPAPAVKFIENATAVYEVLR